MRRGKRDGDSVFQRSVPCSNPSDKRWFGLKLLLVEDEEALSRVPVKELRKCGYAVDAAYGGEEARMQLASSRRLGHSAGNPKNQPRDQNPDFVCSNENGGSGVGAGLGLSLVKEILQKHHWNIQIESTLGTGITFCITIPARMDEYKQFQLSFLKNL